MKNIDLSSVPYNVSLYTHVCFVIRIKSNGRFFRDFGKGMRLKTDYYFALARSFWTDSSPQFEEITLTLDIKKVDYEVIRIEIPEHTFKEEK